MTATTFGTDYRIEELRKLASDLRNERTFTPPAPSALSRIRLAIGETLVQVGTAVAAGNRRTAAQAR
jgi:hypothetical protein